MVKLLLVDDLRENLLALGALLEREGVELMQARSGREALEILLAHDVALALIDVQMPEMDGFELAELMRGTERTRHVPIIFLTAGPRDTKGVFRGYEVGAVDFLFKPIDPVLLSHKVTTFVELHRQRLEVERMADELREVLRLNEMFVAAVGHDLRSPLSTVITGAALLDRENLEPPARKTLVRIRSSAKRMLAMLEQLNDLARARLGDGISLRRADTNFRTLADTVIEELRIAFPKREVLVSYDGESTSGMWDEARLEQVIANLVGNALRHGSASEPVRFTVHGATPSVVFEVHNGGFIGDDVKAKLFDPFRRGSTGVGDSLGLGLYIVDQIVRAHGGSIFVETSEATGTTFRVELPRG